MTAPATTWTVQPAREGDAPMPAQWVPRLEWTTDAPTLDGWYWARFSHAGSVFTGMFGVQNLLVHIPEQEAWAHLRDLSPDARASCWLAWAGPIAEPRET